MRVSALLGIAACVATALTAGCAHEEFRASHVVTVTMPKAEAVVRLPFRVAWKPDTETASQHFAVLFDQAPPSAGQPLLSLVPTKDPCRSRPDCPDAQWLTDNKIFVTDSTDIVVSTLTGGRRAAGHRDVHDVVLIQLDARGRRVGETAVLRTLVVDRSS